MHPWSLWNCDSICKLNTFSGGSSIPILPQIHGFNDIWFANNEFGYHLCRICSADSFWSFIYPLSSHYLLSKKLMNTAKCFDHDTLPLSVLTRSMTGWLCSKTIPSRFIRIPTVLQRWATKNRPRMKVFVPVRSTGARRQLLSPLY